MHAHHAGDSELLLLSMDSMNSDPDPEAEDRKGCSSHVGKMIYSAGVTQLALVAYVPDVEHNKSAAKIDVKVRGAACNPMGWSLQPHGLEPATPWAGACNPTCWSLQP